LAQSSHLFEPVRKKNRTKTEAFAPVQDKLETSSWRITIRESEERMTKFRFVGAAVILSTVLAGPAMAKHTKVKHPIVAAAACDPRDPGNPFSRTYDFQAWSAWRRRGSWDTRAEWTCQPIPQHPFGTVF